MNEIEPRSLPTVVIVGRPNVGKSTLFNRFIGEQAAIVEDRPGVTRDRKELEAEWLGVPFRVIDTGGWMPGGSDLDEKVSRQVEHAVDEADLVLFVVDATVGVLEEDEAVATWLRRGAHQTVVVVNKAVLFMVSFYPAGGGGVKSAHPDIKSPRSPSAAYQ